MQPPRQCLIFAPGPLLIHQQAEPLQEAQFPRSEKAFRERAAEIYKIYSEAHRSRFGWTRPAFFKKELGEGLLRDSRALLKIFERCNSWNPKNDAKLKALIKLVSEKHKADKVLIFSQFGDTVEFLAEQLRNAGVQRLAAATGESPDVTELAWRFSPVRNKKQDLVKKSPELRVMVATDVLSEGQNLQDCFVVVNYDLPWAIISGGVTRLCLHDIIDQIPMPNQIPRRRRSSTCARIFGFGIVSLGLLLTGCSYENPSSKEHYTLPAELHLDTRAQRGPQGETYIVGTTNFPDGMKLWVHVGIPKVTASDDSVHVLDSKFITSGLWQEVSNPNFSSAMLKWPDGANLRFRKRPVRSGTYKVQFEAYFNSGWQTPEVLAMLGGEGAKNLQGKMFVALNPDVTDSSKKLDYTVTLQVPELQPEARAISLVKAAGLTAQGKGRSATDVEANIELFMELARPLHGSSALQAARGWSAEARGDTYEVIFDYTDSGASKQAIWSADLRTGEVKYVNENAKLLSWTPAY
jgi:hypothetical protein